MKKMLYKVAIITVMTIESFASNKNTNDSFGPHFYVGLGFGGQHYKHTYKVQEIGFDSSTGKFNGSDQGEKKFSKTSPAWYILMGARTEIWDRWFIGCGLEADFTRMEAAYKEGINFQNNQASNIINSKRPRIHKILKGYCVEANIQLGYTMEDVRFYGKIGISQTQLKYSFQSDSTMFPLTDFENKLKNTIGIVPGIGIERKMTDNVWGGLEISMPIYGKNRVIQQIRADRQPVNGEFIPFDGRTSALSVKFTIKYEF